MGSCNTLNDLCNRECAPNKTEDLNSNGFNMIIGINESKLLTRQVSSLCKCKFGGRKCNSNQKCNDSKCWCVCKNPEEHYVFKKDYIWNPATGTCGNGRYAESITDYSVITCDEIIDAMGKLYTEPIKTVPTKGTSISFNEKAVTCETKKIYILLAFLLITITLF